MANRPGRRAALPPAIMSLLGGDRLEELDGEGFCLVSVDASGWPHLALLSVGEVLAVSPSELRLALWQSSATSANLERGSGALLVVVTEGAAWHIRGRASSLGQITAAGEELAAFRFDAGEIIEDRVGYADAVGGLPFRLRDPEKAHRRWGATLEALRQISD
jgi:hypothetical protein